MKNSKIAEILESQKSRIKVRSFVTECALAEINRRSTQFGIRPLVVSGILDSLPIPGWYRVSAYPVASEAGH
jgi:hypothetical protein